MDPCKTFNIIKLYDAAVQYFSMVSFLEFGFSNVFFVFF